MKSRENERVSTNRQDRIFLDTVLGPMEKKTVVIPRTGRPNIYPLTALTSTRLPDGSRGPIFSKSQPAIAFICTPTLVYSNELKHDRDVHALRVWAMRSLPRGSYTRVLQYFPPSVWSDDPSARDGPSWTDEIRFWSWMSTASVGKFMAVHDRLGGSKNPVSLFGPREYGIQGG